MQVKKFEAPTIQEALDTIKRELGPEAIILQTKKNKRGFGLMSKDSVEVTAAVSDRAIQKKQVVEKKLPDESRAALNKLPASKQAKLLDRYGERYVASGIDQHLRQAESTRDRIEVRSRSSRTATAPTARSAQPAPATAKPAGSRRYAEIEDDDYSPAQDRAQAQARHVATPAAAANSVNSFSKMSLEDELRYLKRMVEELKIAQESGKDATGASSLAANSALSSPALQDAFDLLIMNGVDKRFAFSLIKKAGFELGAEAIEDPERVMDQVAAELMRSTEVASPLSDVGPRTGAETGVPNGPNVVALVGPTGVGKTTTVAKLASEALLKRNLKVGLINLDSYKVAAFDQLATYAKILNVPFRSVGSADELKAAMQDFRALDLVLVDTTGRSQKDPESLKEMQSILQVIPGIRSELVVSSTTRDAELYDMANRFSLFRPQGLILSKLDEAMIYGSIYNVCQKVKLPLMYFTTGQRVPEDIEEASRERLAALVLDL